MILSQIQRNFQRFFKRAPSILEAIGGQGTLPARRKKMKHGYTYEAALAASERINWRVEDIIGGDKQLDFSKTFLPESLARVRSWGYNVVRARQLQSTRQEVCVAALQRPIRRKS